MSWMDDTTVSMFSNCTVTNGKPCSLYNALFNISDDDYRTLENIWKAKDKEARDTLKEKLSAFTPCGNFKSRADNNLPHVRTNLMQLDFDEKQNKHWDLDELKRLLMTLPCVGYCGLSCSRTGLFALVCIAEPERLNDYFYHCRTWLGDYKIIADPHNGSSPKQLRLVSFDEHPLWRPSLEYMDEPIPLPIENFIPEHKTAYTPQKVITGHENMVITNCLSRISNAANGTRFNTIQKEAYTIGGFCNENYLEAIYKTIDSSPNYSSKEKKEHKRYARSQFYNGMKKPFQN